MTDKDGNVIFLTETGFRQSSVIAQFGSPVDELKVRRGRLTAKVDGVWHIVPTGPKPR